MTNPELIRKLKYLRRKWRKNSERYVFAMNQERKLGGAVANITAARYEGESIAFRWCAEDLERLCEKADRIYENDSN